MSRTYLHLIGGPEFDAWLRRKGYLRPWDFRSKAERRAWTEWMPRRAATLRWAAFSLLMLALAPVTAWWLDTLRIWFMGIGTGGVLQALATENMPSPRRRENAVEDPNSSKVGPK